MVLSLGPLISDLAPLIREFITIFVVVDPIGTLPVFFFATAGVPEALHRQFALRAVAIAFLVLLIFLVGGQFLLNGLGLRFGSFQIAGGIILFLFALSMIFGDSKPDRDIAEAAKSTDHLSAAVYPLAMPSIASPGAMLAIVVLTDNEAHSIPDQLLTAGMVAIVMLITLALLLMATSVKRVIGATGASVISRIMGMILATVAVDAVLGGLETVGLFSLPDDGAL